MTETEIKVKGMEVLHKHLGMVEAERFVSLIQRESFDYTSWRQGLLTDLNIDDLNKLAIQEAQRQ